LGRAGFTGAGALLPTLTATGCDPVRTNVPDAAGRTLAPSGRDELSDGLGLLLQATVVATAATAPSRISARLLLISDAILLFCSFISTSLGAARNRARHAPRKVLLINEDLQLSVLKLAVLALTRCGHSLTIES
jgi:hypothetical protein